MPPDFGAMDELDQRLFAAHATGDAAALAALYTQAADLAEAAMETDRACFYLTHAWVFALDAGLGEARCIHRRLIRHGRDIQGPEGAPGRN